jgi:hypothetical protein
VSRPNIIKLSTVFVHSIFDLCCRFRRLVPRLPLPADIKADIKADNLMQISLKERISSVDDWCGHVISGMGL